MAEPKAPEEAPPAEEAGAQPGALVDPFRAYNFKLLIDGVTQGHFTRCTGLSVKVEALSYREGGGGTVVRKLAGPLKMGDVRLEYGLTATPELWTWFMASVGGVPERKNVSVLMLAMDGITEVMRWNLNDCWPAEWFGAPLDALGNQIAIESLVLVFESITRG
ncbi:phage tail protein [Myxococcaceae bacterium GXIMD 01537]